MARTLQAIFAGQGQTGRVLLAVLEAAVHAQAALILRMAAATARSLHAATAVHAVRMPSMEYSLRMIVSLQAVPCLRVMAY